MKYRRNTIKYDDLLTCSVYHDHQFSISATVLITCCVEFRAVNTLSPSHRALDTQQFHRNLVAFDYLGEDFC
jgi:hypothetical protein